MIFTLLFVSYLKQPILLTNLSTSRRAFIRMFHPHTRAPSNRHASWAQTYVS